MHASFLFFSLPRFLLRTGVIVTLSLSSVEAHPSKSEGEKIFLPKTAASDLHYPFLSPLSSSSDQKALLCYLDSDQISHQITVTVEQQASTLKTVLLPSDDLQISPLRVDIPWIYQSIYWPSESMNFLSITSKGWESVTVSYDSIQPKASVLCHYTTPDPLQHLELPWEVSFFCTPQPASFGWKGWTFEHQKEKVWMLTYGEKTYVMPENRLYPYAPHWSNTCDAELNCQPPTSLIQKLKNCWYKKAQPLPTPREVYTSYCRDAENAWRNKEGFEDIPL